MSLPYILRLLGLCLGAFFVVHLAAGLVVARLAAAAIRRAGHMRASRAAGFLFALRVLPPAIGLLAVAGVCAPSYLLLEPHASGEEVGFGFLAAAVLGAAICAAALWRSASAIRVLVHFEREWTRAASLRHTGGDSMLVLPEETPFLAMAGIFRPRLVVSRAVLNALEPEELDTAIAHEYAHRASRDNLKRLALLLSPDLLPAWPAFDSIEAAWRRFSEWAADDRAAGGDSARSLSLAAALVRVARLSGAPVMSPLVTPLLADTSELAARVDRLLATPSTPAGRTWAVPALASAAIALTLFAAAQPGTLAWVHGALERLVH